MAWKIAPMVLIDLLISQPSDGLAKATTLEIPKQITTARMMASGRMHRSVYDKTGSVPMPHSSANAS
eukprot:2157153-Pyramimonas_sp.AAC.1